MVKDFGNAAAALLLDSADVLVPGFPDNPAKRNMPTLFIDIEKIVAIIVSMCFKKMPNLCWKHRSKLGQKISKILNRLKEPKPSVKQSH